WIPARIRKASSIRRTRPASTATATRRCGSNRPAASRRSSPSGAWVSLTHGLMTDGTRDLAISGPTYRRVAKNPEGRREKVEFEITTQLNLCGPLGSLRLCGKHGCRTVHLRGQRELGIA